MNALAERPLTKCPAGTYCPLGTASRLGIPCPPGTWSNKTGLASMSECMPVQAGSFSYEGETKEEGSGRCSKGYYCPERSTTSMAVACPPGTYNPNDGGASIEDCLECPGGKDCSSSGTAEPLPCPASYYCPSGSSKVFACPVGTFSNEVGLVSKDQCTPCPAGKFCSIASLATPSGNCEPGFICYGMAETPTPTDGKTGDMCPPGGYCLAGATEVTPCSPGFYNPRYGATSAAACLHCPFGSYCSGSAVTDGGITGPCREGYYCKEGSANDQAYPAPQGSFAPMRSSSPILCYPGTFQSAQGQASCRACPAGKYCQRIEPIPAKRARKSVRIALLALKENIVERKALWLHLEPAKLDFTAAEEAPHLLHKPKMGVTRCAQQDTTVQLVAENLLHAQKGPILVHSRHKVKLHAFLAIQECQQAIPCKIGHECPEKSAEPSPCRPGTYAASEGSAQCQECPAGYYCSDVTVVPEESKKCPSGFFCPAGTGYEKENPCPQGMMNQESGAHSLDACQPCPAGGYCTGPGAATKSGQIDGGYYSSSGAISSKPVPGSKML
ncbi:cast domain-containing protein [Cyclospora cayetanensis]|uniref:Cast domain-containing protein n=1 Tax=Cyclospora cayetanensis TaxID=88456 RepID=A0A1D3D151_9EIME|nr:cast domain-containing protein [Cyclospora cayetanensis]